MIASLIWDAIFDKNFVQREGSSVKKKSLSCCSEQVCLFSSPLLSSSRSTCVITTEEVGLRFQDRMTLREFGRFQDGRDGTFNNKIQ